MEGLRKKPSKFNLNKDKLKGWSKEPANFIWKKILQYLIPAILKIIMLEAKTHSRSKKKSCAFVQLQQFLKSSCAPIY